MHITLHFTSLDKSFSFMRLPSANLHLFQSMLYSILPPEEANILHNSKKLKLFAMSWPTSQERPKFINNALIFPLPVKLTVSTPLTNLALNFAAGTIGQKVRIGNNHVFCSCIDAEEQKAQTGSIIIKTLSPITCYETVEKRGRPYTVYFTPYDREFHRSVNNNLVKKFCALNPEIEPPKTDIKIMPLSEIKERISMFESESSFPIKGWWGKFRLEGPRELLQVALNCGLGAKNSAGWGCIKLDAK